MTSPSACLELARQLPDLPRWVETRSLLLTGQCVLVRSAGGEGDCLVCGTVKPLISVVGRPDHAVSLALAAKFGFEPVDRLTLFMPRSAGDENPACLRTRHGRE